MLLGILYVLGVFAVPAGLLTIMVWAGNAVDREQSLEHAERVLAATIAKQARRRARDEARRAQLAAWNRVVR